MKRSSGTPPIVELRNVHKFYGNSAVLRDLSLSVEQGEVVCIIGPSGSGKSTILRCINGLTTIDLGEVRVANHEVHTLATERQRIPLRRDVAMVFQQYNLFPHRNVLDNIMMAPIQVLKEKRQVVHERALSLLEKVRLQGKEAAFPSQLSGGQQQRVAIARALAMQPRVILFDEVTAALDPEMVSEVLNVIRDLTRDGMTCIIVTHEMRFAAEVADTVAFIDAGTVIETGKPGEVFQNPRDGRLKAFLDKIL